MGMNYKNWQRSMLKTRCAGNYQGGGARDEYKYEREFSEEEARVCLDCTKKKCTGTNKCFEKMKSKTKK